MPAGGLSFDKNHWVHTDKKDGFFVYYKVVSRKFRGKFLDLLQQAFDKNVLVFKGKMAKTGGKKKFALLKDSLYNKEWIVNIQRPLGNPEKILEYLSRYVFRIAITNNRIISVSNGKVLFSWKDNRTNTFRKMSLDIDGFIRRFLLHILPKGFFKVRYYGIFSSRYRKKNITTAKGLINREQVNKQTEKMEDGQPVWIKQNTVWNGILLSIKNHKKPNCPNCKKGRLSFAGIVPKINSVPT
jgi:hypothetical protein